MRGLELFAVLALSLALAAPAGAKPAPVPLSQPAAAAVVQTADALAARVTNGRFPGPDERNAANGPAFLHLAANHPDPVVVAAALRAMSYTWRSSPRKGSKRTVMNDDYVAVVRVRLTDADGPVRGAALRAARLPLGTKNPDPAVVDTLLKLFESANPGDQIAALGAVTNIRAYSRARATKGPLKARVIDAIMPLLKSKEPAVIASALFRLNRSAYASMPKAKELARETARLAKHPEPAVRGEALRLATTLSGKKPDARLLGQLNMALGDAEPYVRATAAELLGELKQRAAVHGLMKLLDDDGSALRKVGGYRDLSGRPGKARFRAETGGRVDDVALQAIDGLTDGIGAPLECKVQGRDRKASRAAGKAAAKAWYGKHKGKLPAAK